MGWRVNWVLDADNEGFFDNLDRKWLREFIRHRIRDKGILRLVEKWLHAGVLEEGARHDPGTGTPQGGVISPLQANIYLHHALDLWIERGVKKRLRGGMSLVRYADDFILRFERRDDAEEVVGELRERLAKFGLRLGELSWKAYEEFLRRHPLPRPYVARSVYRLRTAEEVT
jgi:retron-type reverse transcriptase